MPRLSDPRFAPDCSIVVDGRTVPARAGESVTSALLAVGRPLLARSAKYHRARGPFCLQGSCTACLVRVNGVPNVRACETPCREGLAVETQNAVGGAARDLLGAIDVLAPGGIDHHHLATWSHVANRLAVSASRRLAGLGQLPAAVEERWPATDERFDAVVVGSGPAGLGAAEVLAVSGLRVLLLEREARLGGRLRCALDLPGDPPLAWAGEVAQAVRSAGGDVAIRAPAIGLWSDHGKGALLAVPARGDGPRMRLVRSPRVVLAGGTWAQPPVFEGNDLPGIHGARGLCAALAEDGVVAGGRAIVLGEGEEAGAVARKLSTAGVEVELVPEISRARGRGGITAVELADGRSVRCDVVAVATPRQAAYELAREAGGEVVLDAATGTYRVRPSADDGAVAPGIFAAGELTGPCSAREAAVAGRRAGEAAARG